MINLKSIFKVKKIIKLKNEGKEEDNKAKTNLSDSSQDLKRT